MGSATEAASGCGEPRRSTPRRVSDDRERIMDGSTFLVLVDEFPYPLIRVAPPLVGESRGEIAARRSDSC